MLTAVAVDQSAAHLGNKGGGRSVRYASGWLKLERNLAAHQIRAHTCRVALGGEGRNLRFSVLVIHCSLLF